MCAVTTFLHRDHLASVRLTTHATGAIVTAARYQPFGAQSETTSAVTSREDKAFIGERQDESGLLFLNVRYYDPRLGLSASSD